MDMTAANECFRRTVAALNQTGKPWFAQGGTLLGLWRDGQLMAHDKDLDFGLWVQDFDYSIHQAMAGQGLSIWLQKTWDSPHGRARLDAFHLDGKVSVDLIYWTSVDAGSSAFSMRQRPREVVEYHYPRFQGIDYWRSPLGWVQVPLAPEAWLNQAYGPDWVEPNPGWSNRNSPSTRRVFRDWENVTIQVGP